MNTSSSALLSVTIEPPPSGDRSRNLPWLRAKVRVGGITDRVNPLWQALLVEGAVAELIGDSANLNDDIGSLVVDGVLPDGSDLGLIGGGMGVAPRGQVFSAQSPAEMMASIRAVLPRYGLTEVALTVFQPMGPAPALVASSPQPMDVVARWNQLMGDLFGDPALYEGRYFELRDETGEPLVRQADSLRTSTRTTWASPRYAAIFGIT